VFALAPPAHAKTLLTVGTNAAGAPWSFHDAASGTERGIAVELIAAIARDLDVDIRFVPMPLAELIPALNQGKTDVIAGNLLVTPERAALVAFSDAIAPGGDGLIVPLTDATPYRTLGDLKGLPVASQAGSPFAEAIRKSGLFPDLKIYANGSEAMRAVAMGEVKAAIVGINGAGYDLSLGKFPNLHLVKTYQPLTVSVDAFSVRKGDSELLSKINASLARLHTNGTVAKILEAYGQRTP
jgi:polar amino acid transport system substrate-binding protein